uniref:Uncharacterized protein n=1 Tax=Agrobacterium genomosp. 6 TaxID=1183411 RepID=A0A2Z2PKW1_9HYPH|nr:hypothetical protein [Agrobacterium genomosp. 6]ASK40884.1 hypothetical protein [Agrobacterium genomosp. 6]ASK41459.1 hypothetical protein [Agrobacterium genomosp. 6]
MSQYSCQEQSEGSFPFIEWVYRQRNLAEHFRSEPDQTNCGLNRSIRLLSHGCAVLGPCCVPRRRARFLASIEIIKKQLKIFE